MKKLARHLVFVSVALASMTHSVRARAADVAPSKVDWAGLFDWTTKQLMGASAESPHASPTTAEAAPDADSSVPRAQPLVVLVPRAAVLVRDWRGSMRLAGQTAVTDDLRPSASYRMAVTRIAASGRLAPYLQIGAGQWRLDPVLFPAQPSDEHIAGQLGGGIEYQAVARVRIAGEASYTFLYREPSEDPVPRFITVFVAARASF
jgi:hypothetical protein